MNKAQSFCDNDPTQRAERLLIEKGVKPIRVKERAGEGIVECNNRFLRALCHADHDMSMNDTHEKTVFQRWEKIEGMIVGKVLELIKITI